MNWYKIVRCMIDQKLSFSDVYGSIRHAGYKIIKCPICGKYTMDSHEICKVCLWEQELMKDDNEISSANHTTINIYRKWYREGKIKYGD